MAFLFVERILEIEAGRFARGRLTVPAGEPLRACFVAEAVGQLAAWAAMAKLDFRRRPLAAIAGAARFHRSAAPGATLMLEASLDACDDSAVTYAGSAHEGGEPILQLARCLGPMLPMEDFDDAGTVRSRFEELRAEGVTIGAEGGRSRFGELAPLPAEARSIRRASLRVPTAAPFFADHFPRKPILPGTLLLDALLAVAKELAVENLSAPPAELVDVRDVKLRRFVEPGDSLELVAKLESSSADHVEIALAALRGEERVASARVEMRGRGAA